MTEYMTDTLYDTDIDVDIDIDEELIEEFPEKDRRAAYRRKNDFKYKRRDLNRVSSYPKSWTGQHGYLSWDLVDGEFVPGEYVKYPQDSKTVGVCKKLSNKRNRQADRRATACDFDDYEESCVAVFTEKGNGYKKAVDLKWLTD